MSSYKDPDRKGGQPMDNVIKFTGERGDGPAEPLPLQPSPLVLWTRRAARRCWRGARLFMEGVGWIVFGASIIAAVMK